MCAGGCTLFPALAAWFGACATPGSECDIRSRSTIAGAALLYGEFPLELSRLETRRARPRLDDPSSQMGV